MKDSYTKLSLLRLCQLLGISRQAYYQHFQRQEFQHIEFELVLQQVQTIRKKHPMMGTRKLYELLQSFLMEHEIKLGRDAFFSLLASHDLLIKKRRRRYITTNSKHWLRKWPNLIKDLEINRVNQLWVSDITYWKVRNNHLYISLITDAYSHKIVGYHLANSLASLETQKALKMALRGLSDDINQPLYHHSDRGVQYCSEGYVSMLKESGVHISMTQNGDPLENAIAERVNGILKYEYLYTYKTKSMEEAKRQLKDAIHLYNDQRPHLSVGLKTPNHIHATNTKAQKLWKNYYDKSRSIVNVFQDNLKPVNLY